MYCVRHVGGLPKYVSSVEKLKSKDLCGKVVVKVVLCAGNPEAPEQYANLGLGLYGLECLFVHLAETITLKLGYLNASSIPAGLQS